ncbi:MAG: MOSC domain-containing protein [Gemmataceae bacterium]
MTAYLARIVIFPVKALEGMVVPAATVRPGGMLANDRRYALVDGAGRYINGKRTPLVHTLRVRYVENASRIAIMGGQDGVERVFDLTSDRAALEEYLSDHFGLQVHVIEDAERGLPDDTQAPGPTVVSTASLEAVAEWFGLELDEVRRRFRANLEIGGVPAFWEDRLYGPPGVAVPFRVGSVIWEGTNPCRRCVVPTRHPDTGTPLPGFIERFRVLREKTLPDWASRSRFDHFYRFAVNTRPTANFQPGVIRVGDPVSVCDATASDPGT